MPSSTRRTRSSTRCTTRAKSQFPCRGLRPRGYRIARPGVSLSGGRFAFAVTQHSRDAGSLFDYSRNMKAKQALSAFGALSQETRLEIFRQLVRLAPDAIPAGDLARDLDVPASTLSSHLAILHRAGLVSSE